MSQCVPNWNVDDDHPRPVDLPAAPRQLPRSSAAPLLHHLPMLEYQVAELTWENGQLGMHGHGLGPPRQKPSGGVGGGNGTLESIVKQATCKGGSLLFDAMVPCCHSDQADHRGRGAGAGASETAATVPVATDWEPSLSGSATFGRDRTTVDSFDDLGGGFTSTSLGSAAKTTTADDRDSVSLSLQSSRVHRGGNNNNNVKEKRGAYDGTDEVEKSKESSAKFSIPTKRSRAAAIHNQSERKRRDKINQRMKTLQKLVPNSSKTDKASMLDEVIDYLKQLQAQVQMMSRFNFTPMMQQMPIMTPMGMAAMGMGLGLGMGVFDMATARPNPLPFISITPAQVQAQAQAQAQVPVDRTPSLMPDPLLSFLASHGHQPMTMDAYSRLQAAIYQQMQQKPPPSSSNN